MVWIPFIYFSLFLIYILFKKKTFDISAYIVSLYVISSFFSILIDLNNLRSFDTKNYQITLVPTILYCFLLTLIIVPFYRFKSEKINFVNIDKATQFDNIVYFYFCSFLLILITSFNTIFQILNGDLAALRNALGSGESIVDSPFASNPIIMIAGIFGDFSIVMLLFYFSSICFLKRSKLFNTICLLSSMSVIVLAITGLDRSKIIYWLITYGAMLVLFWKRMSTKQHKNVSMGFILILSLLIIYFISLTTSRFQTNAEGSGGSMISYSGQSFINFCFFFDKVNYDQFSLQRIFPLFYKLFVHNGISSTTKLNAEISLRTGKEIGVFSTFIGDIMVASGKIAAFAYCIAFYITARSILNYKKRVFFHFDQILLIFCLLTVPILGLFTDFYADFTRTLPLILFVGYAFYLKYERLKY